MKPRMTGLPRLVAFCALCCVASFALGIGSAALLGWWGHPLAIVVGFAIGWFGFGFAFRRWGWWEYR